MKRCILPLLLFVFLITLWGEEQGNRTAQTPDGNRDLLIFLDTSVSVLQYFPLIVDYLAGFVIQKELSLGDTIHILTFSDTARVELSRRIEGIDDIRTLITKIYTIFPFRAQTDLHKSFEFLQFYISNLPVERSKFVIIISDDQNGIYESGDLNLSTQQTPPLLIEYLKTNLLRKAISFQFINLPLSLELTEVIISNLKENIQFLESIPKNKDVHFDQIPTQPTPMLQDDSTTILHPVASSGLDAVAGVLEPIDRLRNVGDQEATVETKPILSTTQNTQVNSIEAASKNPNTIKPILPTTVDQTVKQNGNAIKDATIRSTMDDSSDKTPIALEPVEQVSSSITANELSDSHLNDLNSSLASDRHILNYSNKNDSIQMVQQDAFGNIVLDSGNDANVPENPTHFFLFGFNNLTMFLFSIILIATIILLFIFGKGRNNRDIAKHRQFKDPLINNLSKKNNKMLSGNLNDLSQTTFGLSSHSAPLTATAHPDNMDKTHVQSADILGRFMKPRENTKELFEEFVNRTKPGIVEKEINETSIKTVDAVVLRNKLISNRLSLTTKNKEEHIEINASVKSTLLNTSGRILLKLWVKDQNPNIGRRNTHMLKAGKRLSLGGKKSDFLIFLVPFPKRIASIHYDGENCTLIPRKSGFFQINEQVIPDCVGKNIFILSERGQKLIIRFEVFEDPLLNLNAFLHSIDIPG